MCGLLGAGKRSDGVFVTSTGEAPGTNRLEICGTRGRLVLEDNRLRFTRNEADMIEFSRSAKAGFARPDIWNIDIPFDNAPAQHATLMQNFVDSILDGAPLVAPGEDGLRSVELANAMLYSSILGQPSNSRWTAPHEEDAEGSDHTVKFERRSQRSAMRISRSPLCGDLLLKGPLCGLEKQNRVRRSRTATHCSMTDHSRDRRMPVPFLGAVCRSPDGGLRGTL